MYSGKQAELFDAIFKVFPNASVVSRTERPPSKEPESFTIGNSGLAKRAKPQGTASRASKHKVSDSRQLSLFDGYEGGGI